MDFSLPTARLPSIRSLQTTSPEALFDALYYLAHIYSPNLRGNSRLQRRRLYSFVSHTSVADDDATVTVHKNKTAGQDGSTGPHRLLTDPFERAYAIRWLTALVSQDFSDTASHQDGPDRSLVERPQSYDDVLTRAASLLAVCSGASAAGAHTRLFKMGDNSDAIEVLIRDAPLDNGDFASVGAQTWGSASVLSDLVVESPGEFGLLRPVDSHVRPQRPNTSDRFTESDLHAQPDDLAKGAEPTLKVLELGAGTGLVGLVIARVLRQQQSSLSRESSPQFSVIATDFYPPALDNLRHNIALNSLSDCVFAHFLDWEEIGTPGDGPGGDQATPLTSARSSSPRRSMFDVIVGADVVYEPQHVAWIKNCVQKLLRRPEEAQHVRTTRTLPDRLGSVLPSSPSPPSSPSFSRRMDEADIDGVLENSVIAKNEPCFHLVMPLRPTHQAESDMVTAAFSPGDGNYSPSRVRIMAIRRPVRVGYFIYGDRHLRRRGRG